jgi:hypothetical protein
MILLFGTEDQGVTLQYYANHKKLRELQFVIFWHTHLSYICRNAMFDRMFSGIKQFVF